MAKRNRHRYNHGGTDYSAFHRPKHRLLTVDVDPAAPFSFIFSPDALAQRLDVVPRNLWHIVKARNSLYTITRIAKRSGKGTRELHAPSDRKNSLSTRVPSLKGLQKKILHNILDRIPLGKHVGAYVHGRSIKDVAQQHVGKAVVISLDLKNFFPSVRRGTIRAYLHRVQKMPDQIASMLAALMCYKNFVPQGAPTSGAICNLIADWKMDQALLVLLKDIGWTYTRYSDDLTFSHSDQQTEAQVQELLQTVASCAEKAGFCINPEKTRIMTRPHQQKVLGLVVNDKVGIDPEAYKELRAIFHNCAKTGFVAQAQRARVPVDTFVSRLKGKLSYLQHVDADKAAALVQQLEEKWPQNESYASP